MNEQQITGKFYTPDALAREIVYAIRIRHGLFTSNFDGLVLEPSVGGGAFARALKAIFPRCKLIGVDTDGCAPGFAACDGMIVGDFADVVTSHKFDLVIGNPPFSVGDVREKKDGTTEVVKREVAESHVRKALSLLREHGVCAMLLRAAFLHPAKRSDLLEQLDVDYRVNPRPPFAANGKTDNSDYSVFVWSNRDMTFGRNLTKRLSWEKGRSK